MKSKIDKEMDRLVKLGILKKGISGYSSPAMAIPRKNSSIPRVVGYFRYLNKRLVKLKMTFPLVRKCIQAIGTSQCEIMSVIDLRDAYHTLCLAPSSQQYTGIHTILWCRYLPISSNGYGFEYFTSYMAYIY